MKIDQFGRLASGESVARWRWGHPDGFEIAVTALGGIITELWVPDANGKSADVVLGFDDPNDYLIRPGCFGALLGRYANRIAYGRFTLNGADHQLTKGRAKHALHGGLVGFHQVVWAGEPFEGPEGPGLRLTKRVPDGDQGFPGALDVEVTYQLSADRQLIIDYHASTDAPTLVNLSQHSYFHLSGHASGQVYDHTIQLDADQYTPVDEDMIPTGDIAPVSGTSAELREARRLGDIIGQTGATPDVQAGFDYNWVLNHPEGPRQCREVAQVIDTVSGRSMRVLTDQPGLQVYTANHLTGEFNGKGGVPYVQHAGLALETQHFPDSPNKPNFPSTTLMPGEEYRSRTVYAFGV
ncbi:MAG: galactose mutarotase [Parvularculaceae bacterium]|nr:galactose mutarotase [Parvularculaceae bacterium]